MYVYLSGSGAEVFLPSAVTADANDEELILRDALKNVVAVFPAKSVIIYSVTRLEEGGNATAITQQEP